MTPFRFSVERVLAWRRTELALEQARYQQALASVAALDRARAELEAVAIQSEVQVRSLSRVAGAELAALSEFRRAVRARETEIARRRVEAAKAADLQLQGMLASRRRCRLLERLRERRLEEWKTAENRELEQLAGEIALRRRGSVVRSSHP